QNLRRLYRTLAPEDEAAQGIPSPRLIAEPFSVIPISRCQTAHLVPAAHFCARVLPLCFTHPEPRGGRSAEKRSGATAPVRHAMTRHARRLATRLASHDAGRSPLGAPPWRGFVSPPRLRLLRRPPAPNRRPVP